MTSLFQIQDLSEGDRFVRYDLSGMPLHHSRPVRVHVEFEICQVIAKTPSKFIYTFHSSRGSELRRGSLSWFEARNYRVRKVSQR